MSQDNADIKDTTFYSLGILPAILSILTRYAYTQPTAIQARAIGPALSGKDIIGIAQTGTGKTLAFSIPVIQSLIAQAGMALILVPTRELALQVHDTVQKIAMSLHMKSVVLIGGASMNLQTVQLGRSPRIVIATPGRLLDHIMRKNVSLDTVKFLVLDEADRMLDMGFLPAIKEIVAHIPKQRQTLLFSATVSPDILAITSHIMQHPIQIETAPQGSTVITVTQEAYIIHKESKTHLLQHILKTWNTGPVIVFTRTKFGATRVSRHIQNMGHAAVEIHSNRSLGQRKMALAGFKSGAYRILVATDVVARGIDVKNVSLVINFDLPDQPADYVHRIGRTARAGATGHAISLVTPEQRQMVNRIERLTKKPIKLLSVPLLPSIRQEKTHIRKAHHTIPGQKTHHRARRHTRV